MPFMSHARSLARWTRLTGAVVATVGIALAAVPPVASAVESSSKPVTIEVLIGEQESAALAGAVVTLRSEPGGREGASSTTGPDGRVTLDIDPTASSQYSAGVSWPAGGGEAGLSTRAEFASTSQAVTVTLRHPYRFVSGAIAATAGGAQLSNMTGGAAVISRGGTTLQTIPLAADGSFRSGALPTTTAEEYRLALTPPAGYLLADSQPAPNAAFALPADPGEGTTLDVARQFSVAPVAVPTPTPQPTPTPSPAPEIGVTPVVLPSASSLGAGLRGMREAQLRELLASTARAGRGNTVAVTNGSGQVLGLASQPSVPIQRDLEGLLDSVIPAARGVSITSIDLTSMDLETAMMMVQSQRATQLDAQLTAQIQEVQYRNERIAVLNAALNAVDDYVAETSGARFEAAAAAVRAAGVVSDPFLDATATTAVAAAPAMMTKLRGLVDAAGNSQQMDLLRLQSMSNKRNEAFDVMTNFMKKTQGSRSSIIANMRSTPVDIGTVQWDRGVVTGAFDLSAVPDGSHHLILTFADAGVTIIAEVEVQRETLPVTGGEGGTVSLVGISLLLLGLVAMAGAPLFRQRQSTATHS